MARQYHGKRIFHLESARARAEREEQRFRRRHDRLHRQRLRHPDMRDARHNPSADPFDDFADLDDDDEEAGDDVL